MILLTAASSTMCCSLIHSIHMKQSLAFSLKQRTIISCGCFCVVASVQIRDGLGTPLEGTEAFFFTSDPSNDMQGPNTAAGGQVSPGHCSGIALALCYWLDKSANLIFVLLTQCVIHDDTSFLVLFLIHNAHSIPRCP